MRANGAPGLLTSGGGAGGSIHVTSGSPVTGGGPVFADGGDAGTSQVGGGGGGLILIEAPEIASTLQARGGAPDGGAGMFGTDDGQNIHLVAENGGQAGPAAPAFGAQLGAHNVTANSAGVNMSQTGFLLDVFAVTFPFALQDKLEELAYLFAGYLEVNALKKGNDFSI